MDGSKTKTMGVEKDMKSKPPDFITSSYIQDIVSPGNTGHQHTDDEEWWQFYEALQIESLNFVEKLKEEIESNEVEIESDVFHKLYLKVIDYDLDFLMKTTDKMEEIERFCCQGFLGH